MKSRSYFVSLLVIVGIAVGTATPASAGNADAILREAVFRWMDLAQPETAEAARTVQVEWRLTKSAGLPEAVEGMSGTVTYRWPDKLRATVSLKAAATAQGEQREQFHAG